MQLSSGLKQLLQSEEATKADHRGVLTFTGPQRGAPPTAVLLVERSD